MSRSRSSVGEPIAPRTLPPPRPRATYPDGIGAQGQSLGALEGRFGALDADALAAIEAAQEDPLMAVVAHVSVDSLEQARARLGLP